ncbi:uncharacterized protein LOC142098574 [Mixophyes fleayi]|uniref:uncharacterized protein LOC142098574 n=1 Tax=Mixophyes fleayi TaxID=3061075 RepID=UPI003F4DEC5B
MNSDRDRQQVCLGEETARETDGSQKRDMDSLGQSRGRNGVVVGISSRSSENDLKWLKTFIYSEFKTIIVKYLPITNRNQYSWEEEVKKCNVVILYHTKNQGRINIVDIDGALYDKELTYMSNTLGRDKVLVVLDDVENASEDDRQRILEKQPSIQRLSSQFLIFTEYKNSEADSSKKMDLRMFIDWAVQSSEKKEIGKSQDRQTQESKRPETNPDQQMEKWRKLTASQDQCRQKGKKSAKIQEHCRQKESESATSQGQCRRRTWNQEQAKVSAGRRGRN